MVTGPRSHSSSASARSGSLRWRGVVGAGPLGGEERPLQVHAEDAREAVVAVHGLGRGGQRRGVGLHGEEMKVGWNATTPVAARACAASR